MRRLRYIGNKSDIINNQVNLTEELSNATDLSQAS